MRSRLTPLALLRVSLVALTLHATSASAAATAEAGAGDAGVPGWVQPPRRAVVDEDAVRWPLDATLRFTFFGPLCPSPDLVDLRTSDGAPVAASIRVHETVALAELPEQGNTLVEVDPVEPLTPQGEYTLQIEYASAALGLTSRSVDFKAKTRGADPLPEAAFGGITDVSELTDNCTFETGAVAFLPARSGPPACPGVDRVVLRVRYTAVIRPDLTYVVERVSSTPAGGERVVYDPPQALSFDPGGDEREVGDTANRAVAVTVPLGQTRRDCFAVRMLDALGRRVGPTDNVACIDLPADLSCDVPEVAATPEPLAPRGCGDFWLHTEGVYAPDSGVDDGGRSRGPASDGCSARPAAARFAGPSGLLALAGCIVAYLRLRPRPLRADRRLGRQSGPGSAPSRGRA